MQNFKNKVAVITGAASGIGLGIAIKCATEGMKVVLADFDEINLKLAEDQIRKITPYVISVITDVSKLDNVALLAQRTLEAYNQVDLLINNAGVGGPLGPIWEIPIDQLKWTLDINLMGVVYGIKTFIPIMKKQGTPCHIVNVSSHSGLTSAAHFTPYQISKHAVVTLTESLQQDLIAYGYTNIVASVFLPFFVQSNIANLSPNLIQKNESIHVSEGAKQFLRQLSIFNRKGITSQSAADILFAGIKQNSLYIFTNEQTKAEFQVRCKNILE